MKPNKILTFSYDDGVTQDIRLIELFNKYGIKATFNLNSGLLGQPGAVPCCGVSVSHNKVKPEDVRHIYAGHEVAAHTLTHPLLPAFPDNADIIRQVEEDRLALSELCGYEVVGFAYPCGGVNFDDRVADLIKNRTGIKYARTTVCTHSFDVPSNLYQFTPSIFHNGDWDEFMTLVHRFLDMKADTPQLLYIWGHAYEFDVRDTWGRFEEFLKLVSGRDDIYYATNKEALL